MTEEMKNDNSATPQQTESDVLVLVKKMLEQMVYLEKKIDILISQSQDRPSRGRFSSKPSRPFGRPFRGGGQFRGKRDQGDDLGERGSHSGHHFKKRQDGEGRGFGGPRKDYSEDRENSSGQGRPFKKKFGGKKGGFGSGRKVPFYKQRGRKSSEA